MEQLAAELDDMETALEIAQLPDMEGWYDKQPPPPLFGDPSVMRPVYQYRGEEQPLLVKSVADQMADKPFRFATQAEAVHYVTAFRHAGQSGQTRAAHPGSGAKPAGFRSKPATSVFRPPLARTQVRGLAGARAVSGNGGRNDLKVHLQRAPRDRRQRSLNQLLSAGMGHMVGQVFVGKA